MTAEEFFDWVDRPENHGRHFELERGTVVEVSRPGEAHGVVCVNVGWILGGYIRQRRTGDACGNAPPLPKPSSLWDTKSPAGTGSRDHAVLI